MDGRAARLSSIPKSPGAGPSPARCRANTGSISFIREIAGASVEDITADILAEATLPDIRKKPICRPLGSITCAIFASTPWVRKKF